MQPVKEIHHGEGTNSQFKRQRPGIVTPWSDCNLSVAGSELNLSTNAVQDGESDYIESDSEESVSVASFWSVDPYASTLASVTKQYANWQVL